MAVVDAVALVEHVFGLSCLGVVGTVLVDVGSNIGQEIRTVASLLEVRPEPAEVPLVGVELLAEQRQVILLERRGRKRRFRVEQTGKLGDGGISLEFEGGG